MAEEIVIKVTAQDNFSGVLGNFGNIITGIRSAIDLAAGAFRAIAEPIIDFGREAVMTASRVDELALVNEILAQNAGIAVSSIQPLVDSIRGQGIEAGVAEEMVAQMIRANLDLANATDLARVAQDAAVISGMNSSETLDNIVYGITTLNPLVLRHAGIIVDLQLAYKEWAAENDRTVESLTTAEKQQIAMNEVLESGTAIAGSYETAMGNAFKQLGSFPRYINDILVAIGEPFQEAFGTAVFSIAEFLKWIGTAVEEGGDLRPVINEIADAAEYLAENFVIALETFQSVLSGDVNLTSLISQAVQDVDWGVVTDAFVQGVDNIDWSAVGVKFGEGLRVALGIGAEQAGEVNWTALVFEPIKAAGEFLAGWFAGFWKISVSGSFEEAIAQWKSFFIGLGPWLRNWAGGVWGDIQAGFSQGWGDLTYFFKHPFEVALVAIKEFLGISSPSTVFFQIGRDIVMGLIAGIGSMLNAIVSTIQNLVSALLGPLEPILSLLGIDLGTTGTTTGTTGGRTPITGDVRTGTAQAVNNYYYGPVYFQGAGEPGAYYDCPSPNPIMTAGSGSLGTHVVGR